MYIHKHFKNITCKKIAETSKGYQVEQTETFSNKRKKPKTIKQYYNTEDFTGPNAIWEKL